MVGFAILVTVWLTFGATGAWLAYRRSMRAYGKNIYGKPLLAATVLLGFPAFVGSAVAW